MVIPSEAEEEGVDKCGGKSGPRNHISRSHQKRGGKKIGSTPARPRKKKRTQKEREDIIERRASTVVLGNEVPLGRYQEVRARRRKEKSVCFLRGGVGGVVGWVGGWWGCFFGGCGVFGLGWWEEGVGVFGGVLWGF